MSCGPFGRSIGCSRVAAAGQTRPRSTSAQATTAGSHSSPPLRSVTTQPLRSGHDEFVGDHDGLARGHAGGRGKRGSGGHSTLHHHAAARHHHPARHAASAAIIAAHRHTLTAVLAGSRLAADAGWDRRRLLSARGHEAGGQMPEAPLVFPDLESDISLVQAFAAATSRRSQDRAEGQSANPFACGHRSVSSPGRPSRERIACRTSGRFRRKPRNPTPRSWRSNRDRALGMVSHPKRARRCSGRAAGGGGTEHSSRYEGPGLGPAFLAQPLR